jgi:hypothetical protein
MATRFTTLSPNAMETARCLFLHGPTWDGDIPSKEGRGELFRFGYADRVSGWSFLTKAGVDLCIDAGYDREKNRRDNIRRRTD